MFSNISDENKKWIIGIVIYYFVVFSGIGKNLSFISVLLAAAGWILVPVSVYLFSMMFWDKFDNAFLKVVYIIFAIIFGYIIYFQVEIALNVFFDDANCIPSYWRTC